MPCGPSTQPSAIMRLETPAFDGQYATCSGAPTLAEIEDTATMAPPRPCATMCLAD